KIEQLLLGIPSASLLSISVAQVRPRGPSTLPPSSRHWLPCATILLHSPQVMSTIPRQTRSRDTSNQHGGIRQEFLPRLLTTNLSERLWRSRCLSDSWPRFPTAFFYPAGSIPA